MGGERRTTEELSLEQLKAQIDESLSARLTPQGSGPNQIPVGASVPGARKNMVIRPIDLRGKEFKSSFRGYNIEQVDEFLDSVADEFERIYAENQRMREETYSLRERLEQFERLEDSIQAALVHAEKAASDLRATASQEAEDLRRSAAREAENLRRSATREAELTLQEAKTRAHQMLAKTSEQAERVRESYEAMREAKRLFSADFRHVLRSYLEVLDKADAATAKEIEASLRERFDNESMAAARRAAEHEGMEREEEGSGEQPTGESSEKVLSSDAGTHPSMEPTSGDLMESSTGDLSAEEENGRAQPEVETPRTQPEVETPTSIHTDDEEGAREAAEQASSGSSDFEEEVEEEHALAEKSALAKERSSEEFWEQDEENHKDYSSVEDRQQSRIFHARGWRW